MVGEGVLVNGVPLDVGVKMGVTVGSGLSKNNQALLNLHTAVPAVLMPKKPRKPSDKEATLPAL